jgi:hypothetical protein
MNQNAVEKKCCSIYSDVQEFFKTVKREPDFGFKVLNSPPIYRPRFLFIGYQPGGGCEDAINERDRGMERRWPEEPDHAVRSWRLSKIMRELFGLDVIMKSIGMNAIFLRHPTVKKYKKNIERATRHCVANFCREKVLQIIDVTEPQKIVAIGFDTLKLFGPTQPDLKSAKGRCLTCTGTVGERPALATLHLTGARISLVDRDAIRDRVLAN